MKKPSSLKERVDALAAASVDLTNASLEEMRKLVSAAQEMSPTRERVERMEALHEFLSRSVEEVARPLLADPFTELTRKRQTQLLAMSALCLVASLGQP